VDVRAGHKTGFYLDQRDNRLALRDFCQGKEVLDCFCSTGGFTLNALTAGAASVTSIDSSGPSLEMLARNLELNGLPGERCTPVEGDVFRLLRKLREENRTFDTIILDPPKFAQSKGDLEKAMRGYKDINMQAFQLLKPGGVLFTFSCSGLVSGEMFQKAAAWAAMDAGVQASILKRLFQPPDHPVALNFPEGLYLKGMVIRISPL
jgi:23S rRNA (cytosine1962-C5)-methyltransferase